MFMSRCSTYSTNTRGTSWHYLGIFRINKCESVLTNSVCPISSLGLRIIRVNVAVEVSLYWGHFRFMWRCSTYGTSTRGTSWHYPGISCINKCENWTVYLSQQGYGCIEPVMYTIRLCCETMYRTVNSNLHYKVPSRPYTVHIPLLTGKCQTRHYCYRL